MKRSVWLWVTLLSLLICPVANRVDAYSLKCDRIPDGSGALKSPSDGRFRIRVQGNPLQYIPNEVYTISLASIRGTNGPHKFMGFMLQVENDAVRNDNVGMFQLMGDTMSKFSERCPNVVTHTSSIPKSEIQVRWTAPPPGSGCIFFRATVIEHRDVWYMDDGPLSKMFCEEDSVDIQPLIENPCCACQEAKYEVTFEGLWSRHTHPKDYPSNRWLTRFGDIIGSSHTVEYRFWEYGQQASNGLKQLAEHGSTRDLEAELKAQSEHIRTIIKARGISYPNVTGKTFAVFRVDSRHHLVSLVSQIDPSPDWIVGVSGLELCLSNCTWIDQKSLNLYPWDIGTDSGPTYTSNNEATMPQDVIRRIKSNFPNDPRSPFYDSTGQDMKPMAKIYITRQRLYDKNCDSQVVEDERQSSGRGCEVGPWSGWGVCTSSCGKGERLRQREYLDKMAAMQNGCKRQLTQREVCQGHCERPYSNPREEENEVGPECALTEWTEFSECNVQCGQGVMMRSREYVQKHAKKKCERSTAEPPPLQQTVECFGQMCGGDITNLPTDDAYPNPPEEDAEQPRYEDRDNYGNTENKWVKNRPGTPRTCRWSEWSQWSPCNTNCDRGKRMRYRYPSMRNLDVVDLQMRATDVFANMKTQITDDNSNNNYDENENEDEPREPVTIFTPLRPTGDPYPFMAKGCAQLFCFPYSDPCSAQSFFEVVECEQNLPRCEDVPGECFLEPVSGHCRMHVNRWYFDKDRNACGLYSYSGCGGNNNSFVSQADCLNRCKYLQTSDETRPSFHDMSSENQRRMKNCVVTEWQRGECSVTCGEGVRRKVRRIVSQPQNGGRQCPRRLVRLEICQMPDCPEERGQSQSWRTGGYY